MGICCDLCCKDCQETLFVKKASSKIFADPNDLGQFLEKHLGHNLVFLWEDDFVKIEGKWVDLSEWPSFTPPPEGKWWSRGQLYDTI